MVALPFVWFIWTYHCHRAASYALNTRLLQLWYTWLLLHCALFLPPFGPILWLLIFKFTPNFGSWLSRILIVVMAFACFSSLFPQLWKHQRTANSFQCSALQFQLATGNFTAASPLYRLPSPFPRFRLWLACSVRCSIWQLQISHICAFLDSAAGVGNVWNGQLSSLPNQLLSFPSYTFLFAVHCLPCYLCN